MMPPPAQGTLLAVYPFAFRGLTAGAAPDPERVARPQRRMYATVLRGIVQVRDSHRPGPKRELPSPAGARGASPPPAPGPQEQPGRGALTLQPEGQ